MRVRACAKCKVYVIIIPSDPINEGLVRKFEKNHRGHTLLTINLSEVKGIYKNTENFDA
ncbi:MAG: hypothetical protein P8Y70_02670 [Candidatus Lokiarchaeota archaeon]